MLRKAIALSKVTPPMLMCSVRIMSFGSDRAFGTTTRFGRCFQRSGLLMVLLSDYLIQTSLVPSRALDRGQIHVHTMLILLIRNYV